MYVLGSLYHIIILKGSFEKQGGTWMNKEEKERNAEIIDRFNYLGNAASATDCTGLIPFAQDSEDELEVYESIYRFGAPSIDRNAGEGDSTKNKGK